MNDFYEVLLRITIFNTSTRGVDAVERYEILGNDSAI